MRHYLKAIITNAVAFWAAYTLVPTIKIGGNEQNILYIIGGLVLVSMAIHPIFNLILLPFNFLTFGLLTLVLNVALLFVLINFLPGFDINAYNFPGAEIQGFIIPKANLSEFSTILVTATIITVCQKVLRFIFD